MLKRLRNQVGFENFDICDDCRWKTKAGWKKGQNHSGKPKKEGKKQ